MVALVAILCICSLLWQMKEKVELGWWLTGDFISFTSVYLVKKFLKFHFWVVKQGCPFCLTFLITGLLCCLSGAVFGSHWQQTLIHTVRRWSELIWFSVAYLVKCTPPSSTIIVQPNRAQMRLEGEWVLLRDEICSVHSVPLLCSLELCLSDCTLLVNGVPTSYVVIHG